MNQDELTALFKKLGARNPEGWARSQLEEGIPQLARFLFLRQAWAQVVHEDDGNWIHAQIQRSEKLPDEPFAGVGLALQKLRARGATDGELTDLVRGMQAELLYLFCHLLEDPGVVEPEVKDIAWGLVQVDEKGKFVSDICGLHGSVLETDPTGREMRRRGGAG
jgi:hypothetical protein